MRCSQLTKLSLVWAVSIVLILVFTGCNVTDGPDEYKSDGSTWTEIGGQQMPGLRYASFTSTTEVYVVGDEGFIARSTDRGDSWQELVNPATGTNVNFNTAHFLANGRGFVAGRRGHKMFTDDHGETWDDRTDIELAEIHWTNSFFLDDNTGFLLNSHGELYKTLNTGESWELMPEISHDDIVNDVFFLDDNVGFACGAREKRWLTEDGGLSWTELEDEAVHDTTTRALTRVAFFNRDTGIVVGDVNTHKWTGDGGETWEVLRFAGTRAFEATYIAITGPSQAYVTAASGAIWKTEDKGQTWESYPSSIEGPIYRMGFIDGSIGYQVGTTDTRIRLGAFKITVDGGAVWEYRSFGIGTDLHGVVFLDINNGWACGISGYLFRTMDGGETWNHLESATNQNLYAIDFFDDTYGWSVGSRGTILKTTNGGVNWFVSDSGDYTSANYLDVFFVDETHGFICGANSVILKTTDGGRSWVELESPIERTWNKMHFLDRNNGYIVGENGAFMKTEDGGETWTVFETGVLHSLTGIDVTGNNTLWVSGQLIILKSTDGGETWEDFRTFLGTNNLLALYRDVFAFSDKSVWAVGNFGYRAHSVDGGKTWYRQNDPPVIENLNAVGKVGDITAYAVGNRGMVLRLER